MNKFKLVSSYKPSGDWPEAITKLAEGLNKGYKEQTLLGVTGSGKTFTMANVIEQINQRLCWHIIKSFKTFVQNLKNSSQQFSGILVSIMITISQKHIFQYR